MLTEKDYYDFRRIKVKEEERNMIIRFGYCPPNPGPNSRYLKHVRWFNRIKDAIEAYDGHISIWINTTGVYREISYEQLIELKDKYDSGRKVS